MIRNGIRNIARKFGYDFVKTLDYEYGKKFKSASNDLNLDYFKTPVGNYFLPKNCAGDGVANEIKEGRLFDKVIIDVARTFIKPNTAIVDIGANYGQMAIEFSRIAPSCKVYAFEAQEMVYYILEKNLKANNAGNVTSFY